MSDTKKGPGTKPVYTCPNCKTETFDTQTQMINHALPCKRGELQQP